MNTKLQITENLHLESIEENFWEDNKLITVRCWLSFFGQECYAYVAVDDLQPDVPKYTMLESYGEMHTSFVDLLQEPHNWNLIYAQVLLYKKWWIEQYTDQE